MTFENESKEQLEIRQSVRKLALAEIPRFQNENFYGSLPRELFSIFASQGLTGLSAKEEFGGSEASASTISLVAEEIAAVDCGCAIFLSVHNMVTGIIDRFGSKSQRSELVPKLSSGEMLAAFALTEPSAGSDARNLKSEARQAGEDVILNGEKCYITSAGWADLYLVFARSPSSQGADGISAYAVPAQTKGLSISKPEKKMGAELSPIASLHFDNCKLPAKALIGELGKGYTVALSGLAGGRINIASCANGISRSALQIAADHLKERQQFGKKLMEFQALQFMLADMQIKLEAAKLLTWQAAKILEHDPNDSRNKLHPALAKCFASDACMQISTDAVQLLGGSGYIREYKVERMMRDAKMLQIVEGTNQIQRMLIAREILK